MGQCVTCVESSFLLLLFPRLRGGKGTRFVGEQSDLRIVWHASLWVKVVASATKGGFEPEVKVQRV